MRPSFPAGGHREPNVTPHALKKRLGGPSKIDEKSMLWPQGCPGRSQGVLGYPPGSKNCPKYCFTDSCRTSERTLRSRRSAGARRKKVAMVSSPRRLISKDRRWFCPPRAPAKKLAMVSSLKTVFQEMPVAPTFLSSSTTRRHNNAKPPPAHTLLSAAAERSSYGYTHCGN